MGIVFKQSLINTLITYLGFAIGGINYLFLFTKFMSPEYFGLVGVLLAASVILMPLFAFGVPNTIVKFYSGFVEDKDSDSFLTLMLFLPLVLIVPLWFISFLSYDVINNFLASENEIAKGYVWYIFLMAFAMAYFEVFYAWTRVQMKSVFGNFLKEIFTRLGIMIMLILLYLKTIDTAFFLKGLVGLYMVQMLLMMLSAFRLRMPKMVFKWPRNVKNILAYSALIIIGGSAAVLLLQVDKVMLNQLDAIKNVAFYTVAAYMGVAIEGPARSMQQITAPLTAKLLNENNVIGLKKLYQKSSLTLFIVSGILFLLVVLNVNEVYNLIPEEYRGGFIVVFIIGLIKVYDAILGNNTSILYNSDYYKAVLIMGLILAICSILFNLWLIPIYGIEGAAMASLLAFFSFNTIKLYYVNRKFGIHPFTMATVKVLLLLTAIGGVFYFVNFPFHSIVSIIFKSILMVLIYTFVIYRFNISEDVNGILDKFLKRI